MNINFGDYSLLKGKITALEPIHIGTGKIIGNFNPSERYISAKVIRGMLGNYLHEEKSEELERTKIDDDDSPEIFFKPTLPEDTVAVPRNIMWCKRCKKLLGTEDQCEECGQEGKKEKGFMNKTTLAEKKFNKCEVKTTISTKCPINPKTLTSYEEEGGLSPYNIESIIPGTRFDFRLVLKNELIDEVKKWLKEAGIFYGVGGFRTRGYGSVAFNDWKRPIPAEEYIQQKVNEWDSKTLRLVLNSPGVFIKGNKAWVEFGEVFQADLRDKLGIDVGVSIGCNFNKVAVKGWTAKNHKYYMSDIIPAIGAGSTCLLDIEPKDAAKLELLGIGSLHHIHGDVYFLKEA